MTGSLRTIVGCFAFAVMLWFSSHACAQSSAEDRTRARELYAQGQQLFRQGDYEKAQKVFEEAYAAVPNPIVLLSIAECEVRTQQYHEAVLSLSRYLEERPNAPDKTQVQAQIQKLREKPGIVTVDSTPVGAIIFVDGQDTGKLTPADLELPAGDHRITVEISGFQRAEQVVTVRIGSRLPVSFALPEVAKAEPAAGEQGVKIAPEVTTRSNRLPVWVATGVAGAGLVTGVILGGLALKEKKNFDDSPTESLADKGERFALFADVGFGVAAVAGVTAIVLYVTSDDEAPAPKQKQAFSLKPAVAKDKFGLIGKLRF